MDRRSIENLFKHYANADKPDHMFAEEIIRFCGDLKLDPTSLPVLVIAWKFKAKRQCVFSRSEFVDGMYEMGCDSVDKLRATLPNILTELENSKSEHFKLVPILASPLPPPPPRLHTRIHLHEQFFLQIFYIFFFLMEHFWHYYSTFSLIRDKLFHFEIQMDLKHGNAWGKFRF